jgi:hypothetical protein
MSKEDAATKVWETAADGSAEELRALRDSPDPNVNDAFDDLAQRHVELADSQLPWAQEVVTKAKRGKYIGTADAAVEVSMKGEHIYQRGRQIVGGGLWIGRKVAGLFG